MNLSASSVELASTLAIAKMLSQIFGTKYGTQFLSSALPSDMQPYAATIMQLLNGNLKGAVAAANLTTAQIQALIAGGVSSLATFIEGLIPSSVDPVLALLVDTIISVEQGNLASQLSSVLTALQAAVGVAPVAQQPAAEQAAPAAAAAAPIVTGVEPPAGENGTVVNITGSGFTGVTKVEFAGESAEFEANSDTVITATVPVTVPGPLTVTGPGGTSAPINFGY